MRTRPSNTKGVAETWANKKSKEIDEDDKWLLELCVMPAISRQETVISASPQRVVKVVTKLL